MKIKTLARVSNALLLTAIGGLYPLVCMAQSQGVTTFTVLERQSPAFDGKQFGQVGQFELLKGVAEVEIDPSDPKNSIITDLNLAPRLPDGNVRYSTTFEIAKPVDMNKASGVLFHANANRGRGSLSGKDFPGGNEYGDVEVVVGWQADLPKDAEHRIVDAPVARNPDGSDVTGVVLARMADMAPGSSTMTLQVLGREIPYDAVMDPAKAKLIRKTSETRLGVNGPVEEIPAAEWAFADCRTRPFPGVADARRLCLKQGLDPKYLYEMTYQVRNPIVLGVGLAAMRDVNSFLRYETADAKGTPNPLAGKIKKALVLGVSQSGNVLKTFINLGFNQDLSNRIVFDGANPHIAGRQTTINVRFGLPSGSGTLYEPGSEGNLWWDTYTGAHQSRRSGSLLKRCRASNTCPKIFETFGASEFIGRLMGVALTGMDGKTDLPLPENVRRYYFPGTTHGGGAGGVSAVQAPAGLCALAPNPNPETQQIAALRVALSEWVVNGVEPPQSRYPKVADGTLVVATDRDVKFPAIPGVPSLEGQAVGLMDYDFGDQFNYDDLSGVITKQPPIIGATVPPMMPVVDADGNETSGYPSVLHQVPLGTYTGWNPTAKGWFKGQPCGGGLNGGFIAFKTTKAERQEAHDPRQSLEERYGSQKGYVCAVIKAVDQELRTRLLLPADAEALVRQAKNATFLPSRPGDEAAANREKALCDQGGAGN